MTAPERSLVQRRAALKRANDVRRTRARLKADIRAGRRSAITILGEPPESVVTMKVWDLLLVVPKVGRVKANKALTQCRISPSRTIGGLTQRQRDELVALFSGPAVVLPTAAHRLSQHVHSRTAAGDMWCGTIARRPQWSDDPSKITCLTCARIEHVRSRELAADM